MYKRQVLFNAAAVGYLITRNATTAGAEEMCIRDRHMFDGIHGCCFRGNDVELFLKQAYLVTEIREIAADETDIDRIVDQIL